MMKRPSISVDKKTGSLGSLVMGRSVSVMLISKSTSMFDGWMGGWVYRVGREIKYRNNEHDVRWENE